MIAVGKGSPVLHWARKKVVEVFGVDLRSLAVFRIVLAFLVLADLAGRVTDLTAHYTDRGILPRSVLLEDVLSRWVFSLNLMHGEPFFQALLFGVTALAALMLLVGYRTRLATFLVWALLISIHWRNPLVLNTGDVLLRMLLFWGMFLPLGAYWSVDRALKNVSARLSMRFLSLATVGLLLQVAFVYWFTAILKSGETWRTDGTALYYALSIDEWATPIGAYLYEFPTLLKVLTFATLGLEAFGPFLLFCPILTGPVRTGAALDFAGLHLGIWLTMPIGIFSWTAAFCMVCFLPSWFWDKVIVRLNAASAERPKKFVRRLQHAAHAAYARWSPIREWLLATVGAGQAPVASMSVGGGNDRSVNSNAPTNTPAAGPTRKGKGQASARSTAERKKQDGAADSEPVMLRSSLVTNLLAAFFLLYVFSWNLSTASSFTMPERLVTFGSVLGLKQNWGVFAPNPISEGGWYLIPGNLQDGRQVDLMPAAIYRDFAIREGVSWEKPQDVAGTVKNKYWRKYLRDLRDSDNKDLRKHLGRYICREWNAHHTGVEQLVDFQVVLMKEETLLDYQRTTPEKVVLREHSCS